MSELPTTHVDGGWGRTDLWPSGARWLGVVWLIGIFCAYMGALQLFLVVAPDNVALLWLPNAVLVIALLKFRPRDWPYVYGVGLVAEVVGDLTFDVAPHQALFFGVVNAVEATLFVICAALIAGGRRNIGLLSLRGASAVILAAVAVPALTGAVGAIGSVWTFDADYFTAWRSWWFGDGLGLLVGVPVGLLLRDAVRSVARRRSRLLALGVGGVSALLYVLSAALAAPGNAWGAQQAALVAAVALSLTFGAVGAPTAVVLTTTLTLFGLAQGIDGLDSVAGDQTLLFMLFAAIYAIAAITETAHQAMGQLSRTRTDLEKANERLASLSRTDELTGISNRRVLSEGLELLWAGCAQESKPVAMLMVDIDCFHQYNATYGHVSGDHAIRQIGAVIQRSGRSKSDLMVRYGGDEFLIVLPNATLDDAKAIADRIHEQVKGLNIQHSSSSAAPIVTVSIGVLSQTHVIAGAEVATVERCDALLYKAKDAGRNRTVAVQQ